MNKAKVLTTDRQIDAWIAETNDKQPEPVVQHVEFLRQPRLLLLHMSDSRRIPLPVEEIEELAYASDEQLANFQIEGGGFLVHFPDFDGNLDIPFVAAGGRGSAKWVRSLEEQRTAALRAAA